MNKILLIILIAAAVCGALAAYSSSESAIKSEFDAVSKATKPEKKSKLAV